MFCERCGNELKGTAKFCHRCGNKVNYAEEDFFEETNNDTILLQVNSSTNLLNIFLPDLLKVLIITSVSLLKPAS